MMTDRPFSLTGRTLRELHNLCVKYINVTGSLHNSLDEQVIVANHGTEHGSVGSEMATMFNAIYGPMAGEKSAMDKAPAENAPEAVATSTSQESKAETHSSLKSLLDSVDTMEKLVVKSHRAFTTYNINKLTMVDVKAFGEQLQVAMQNISAHSGHVFNMALDPHARDEWQDLTNAPAPLSYEAVSSSLLDVLASDVRGFLQDCGVGHVLPVNDFVKYITHIASIVGRLRLLIVREMTDQAGLTPKQQTEEPTLTVVQKLDGFGATISKAISSMGNNTDEKGVKAAEVARDLVHQMSVIYATFGMRFTQTSLDNEAGRINLLTGPSKDGELAAELIFSLAGHVRHFTRCVFSGYIDPGVFAECVGHMLYNIGQLRILVTYLESGKNQ